MKQYEAVCKKEISQSIRNHGRLLGLELMHQAQPFSKGGAGKALMLGEGAIAKDLNTIFIVLNEFWTEQFKEAKRLNRGLYRKDGTMWLSDEYELKESESAIRAFHQQLRKTGSGGRPPRRGDKTIGRHKSAQFAVVPQELLSAYKKEVIKWVGWAKAGWAKAAQECKADTKAAAKMSGIPRWIKRHMGLAKGGAVDMTNGWWNTSGNPRVILKSGVGYQSKVISRGQITNAVNFVRGKYIRFLGYAIRAELKKAGA
jgi:hypothetical protein